MGIEEFLQNFVLILLSMMSVAFVIALILLVIIIIQVRRINVPPGAGFAETMLYTPLLVVLFLDVLDFALDFLSAPIAWIVLDRLGLKGLRGIATFESLIPLTQPIPTMTLAWIAVRVLGKDRFIEKGYSDGR
ncbi:MAG: hypothetical protein KJ046_09930 [Anaerolineae bacterium]|nr:hypothetical protein [Anaerolineae bacterium]RIK22516.1 MAG: hypothetical protein DCC51_05010 [Anaerolineae bacterium]